MCTDHAQNVFHSSPVLKTAAHVSHFAGVNDGYEVFDILALYKSDYYYYYYYDNDDDDVIMMIIIIIIMSHNRVLRDCGST